VLLQLRAFLFSLQLLSLLLLPLLLVACLLLPLLLLTLLLLALLLIPLLLVTLLLVSFLLLTLLLIPLLLLTFLLLTLLLVALLLLPFLLLPLLLFLLLVGLPKAYLRGTRSQRKAKQKHAYPPGLSSSAYRKKHELILQNVRHSRRLDIDGVAFTSGRLRGRIADARRFITS
jgi:hypothetical protein